jgi:hypothetical protein
MNSSSNLVALGLHASESSFHPFLIPNFESMLRALL